ncbi:MAG: electron transfer flavoprotein subunit beta/FixA family protein [Desulfatiglandales bacterium]
MKELKIIVCAKQIPDPEAPFSAVTVDSKKKEVKVDAPEVISPYDENALEAALRIKESSEAFITVLSVGSSLSDTVLRKAIAAGADQLVMVDDDSFGRLDSNSTAYVLSKAISMLGEYDLILTGRQAGDWDWGQVGLILGEILGLPTINMAAGIRVRDGHIEVKRLVPGGVELVEAKMPALVTVSNEVGELRYVSRSKILGMLKKRIPIKKVSKGDLNLEPKFLNTMELLELLPPSDMRRDCVIIEGATGKEKAERLFEIIKQIL